MASQLKYAQWCHTLPHAAADSVAARRLAMMPAMLPSLSSSVRLRRHSPSFRCTLAPSIWRPASGAGGAPPPGGTAAASTAAAALSSCARCCTPAKASWRAPVAHRCLYQAYMTSGSWPPGDSGSMPRASPSARTSLSRRTSVCSLWLMRPLLRHRLANLIQVLVSSCMSSIRRRTLQR